MESRQIKPRALTDRWAASRHLRMRFASVTCCCTTSSVMLLLGLCLVRSRAMHSEQAGITHYFVERNLFSYEYRKQLCFFWNSGLVPSQHIRARVAHAVDDRRIKTIPVQVSCS